MTACDLSAPKCSGVEWMMLGQHPCGQNALTHADHLRIVEFQGQKAAGGAPGSDADVEQAGKAGGSAGGNAFRQREVAAGP